MRTKDINVEQFNSLSELYSFVEENAFHLERNWDLTELFVKYRNHTKDGNEKQKAQWELEFLLFEFKGAKTFSLSYSTGKNVGEVKQYPSLDEFQRDAFEYLKHRAITTHSPLLSARYNHLLWKAPKELKNREFALVSIKNYISSIKNYYQLFQSDRNRENLFRVGRLFETLVEICDEVKSGIEELKELTGFLLFEASDLEFYSKHGIVDDMLAHPKLFKREDFTRSLSIYEQELKNERKRTDDFQAVHYHLPTAIKVAQKIEADVKRWHNEVGLAYLRLAEQETKEDRFWLKIDNYASAIQAFTLAGNVEKKKETERFYAELKPKVKLPTTRLDFNEETQKQLNDFQEYIKELAKNVLKEPPHKVYRTISSGFFFPKYNDVVKATENKENAFLNFATTIQFDKNKNVKRQIKQEEYSEEIFRTYSYSISMSVLPYLHHIFIPGIKSGHLTFENFIAFIAQESWIGKPYFKTDLGGEQNEINWITLLSPAIVEFFVQIQAWVNSKYYKPSFVLCIDSLALKMEGIFRNFCERLNIPVSIGRQKGMQEAYIHNLLENETIKAFFNDDDLLFFNYLFSSDFGMNLRNNIAHCFYNHDEYHPDKMFLLLAALLRFAKYDYKEVKNAESAKQHNPEVAGIL